LREQMKRRYLVSALFVTPSVLSCNALITLWGPVECYPGQSPYCDDGVRVTCEGEGYEVRYPCSGSLCDYSTGLCLSCGDGILDSGEECDDGNNQNGDGCNESCLYVSPSCGDGSLDADEECDDGDLFTGDGCDDACHIEIPYGCGDGFISFGEECDDGNTIDGDGCESHCACTDNDGDGSPLVSGCADLPADCNEDDETICPSCAELCDGLDNNCDGQDDEALNAEWFVDNDLDGLGDPASSVISCDAPSGYAPNNNDTDDNNPEVPGAPLGDWTQFGGDPGHSGVARGRLRDARLSLLWSQPGESYFSSPIIVGGVVYASLGYYFDEGPLLQAYNAEDGTLLWSFEPPLEAPYSSNPPSWSKGRIFFQRGNHGSDSQLWCLNAADGSVVWSSPFTAQWESYLAPTIADGRVLVNGGSYGGIYGFSESHGTEYFFLGLEQYDQWTPAYANGVAYSFVEGNLRAHDPDLGTILWSISLGWNWSGWSMQTAPVVVDNIIYLASSLGLFAVSANTHQVLWAVNEPFYGVPVVDDTSVYAKNISGSLLKKFDKTTGVFRQSFSGELFYSEAIVLEDAVIISSYDTLSVFNKETTELIEQVPGGTFAIGDNKLVVSESSGGMSVYEWK
jgi:cysteine-rich repeat protein